MKPIVFPADVRDRLALIEAEEGIPAEEQVQRAVSVWTHLRGDERQFVGMAVMRLVIDRARGGPPVP